MAESGLCEPILASTGLETLACGREYRNSIVRPGVSEMSLQNQTISESPRFTGVPGGTERVEAAGGSLDGVLNGGGVRGKRSPKHEPTADGLPPESSTELADSQPPAKKKAKLVNEGETKEAGATTTGAGAADSEGASLLMVFADFAASSLPLAPGTATTAAGATRSPPTATKAKPTTTPNATAPSLADVRFSAPPPFSSVPLSAPTLSIPPPPPSTTLPPTLHGAAPRAALAFPTLSASPTAHLAELANGASNAHFQVDPNGLSSPSEPKRKARKITPQLDPRVASASLASTGHSTVNIAGILGQQAAQAGSTAPPALPLVAPPAAPLALPLLKPNALNKPLGLATDSLHTSPFAVKELKRCATHIKIAYHIVRVQHAAGPLAKSTATPKLADAATLTTPLQTPQGARPTETSSTVSPAPPLTAVPRPSLHNVATPTISQPQPLMMASRPTAALSQSLGIDQQTFESLLALPPLHLQQLAQQGNPVALLVLQYQHQQQQQMGLLSAAANNPLLQQLYAQSMLAPGARTPNAQPNMNNPASVAHLQQLYLQQQQQYQMQMYQLQLLQQQAQLQQLHQQRVQQQQFQGLSNSQNAINSLNASASSVPTINALPNPTMTSSIAQTALAATKDAAKQNSDETDTNSAKMDIAAPSGHVLPNVASAASSATPNTSNEMDISVPAPDAALQALQSHTASTTPTLSSSRSSIPSLANASVPLLPLASATLLTDTVHVKIEDALPGHKPVPLPSPALNASSESNSSNSSTMNRAELNIKGEAELFRSLTSALQASANSALQNASDSSTTSSNSTPATVAAAATAPAGTNEASASSSSSISQPQSIAS